MYSDGKKLAYLKVLAALAWADGELSNRELNYLKNLAFKLRLSEDAWRQLEPCLYDAVTAQEARKLLQEFLCLASGAKERRQLLESLKQMARADEKLSEQEQRFLEQAADLIDSTTSFSALCQSFKKLFGKNIAANRQETEDFFNNKILYLLRRRIQQGKLSPVEPARLKYLALFGGLLGRVAFADHDFSPSELNYLKIKLNKLGLFSPHEASLVATVIKEATLKGVDNAKICADFFAVSTQRQRQQLLESLFALAGADGHVSPRETEEIRSIANAFGLSHQQFIAAKLAAKNCA